MNNNIVNISLPDIFYREDQVIWELFCEYNYDCIYGSFLYYAKQKAIDFCTSYQELQKTEVHVYIEDTKYYIKHAINTHNLQIQTMMNFCSMLSISVVDDLKQGNLLAIYEKEDNASFKEALIHLASVLRDTKGIIFNTNREQVIRLTEQNSSFVEFMRNSPLFGLELEIEKRD